MSILGTDLTAVGLGTLALLSDSESVGPPLLLAGGLSYVFGGPIVHATRGSAGKFFGSLGLRVGAPLLGIFVGVSAGAQASHGCSGEMCGLGGVVAGGAIGFGLGALTASVIDITLLAYESKPESPALRVALVPALDPNRGSASLNLRGTW